MSGFGELKVGHPSCPQPPACYFCLLGIFGVKQVITCNTHRWCLSCGRCFRRTCYMLWPNCQHLGAGPALVICKVMATSPVTWIVA